MEFMHKSEEILYNKAKLISDDLPGSIINDFSIDTWSYSRHGLRDKSDEWFVWMIKHYIEMFENSIQSEFGTNWGMLIDIAKICIVYWISRNKIDGFENDWVK